MAIRWGFQGGPTTTIVKSSERADATFWPA
jgi:hypothetical protein